MNVRVTIGNPVARRSIEDAIDRMLAMLDRMDPDPDLEPSNDDEPSLGWPASRGPSQLDTRQRLDDDREKDDVDDEDGRDDELTLGWTADGHVGSGTAARSDECEEENEHGDDWRQRLAVRP